MKVPKGLSKTANIKITKYEMWDIRGNVLQMVHKFNGSGCCISCVGFGVDIDHCNKNLWNFLW